MFARDSRTAAWKSGSPRTTRARRSRVPFSQVDAAAMIISKRKYKLRPIGYSGKALQGLPKVPKAGKSGGCGARIGSSAGNFGSFEGRISRAFPSRRRRPAEATAAKPFLAAQDV